LVLAAHIIIERRLRLIACVALVVGFVVKCSFEPVVVAVLRVIAHLRDHQPQTAMGSYCSGDAYNLAVVEGL
jgi:hypothetical protein